MGLHELKPVTGKSGTTTTIVTGGRDSSDSDEAKILDHHGRALGGWDGGISKSVTTTVVEEHNSAYLDRAPRREQPSTPTIERRRNGSPGGDSASTVGDADIERPTRPYGAF